MSDENYYVKVQVDGVAVPDAELCGGNPTSNRCRYKVSGTSTKQTMETRSDFKY